MELIKISDVKEMFNTTTRALRYYEEIGLIESKHVDDYAYRLYDENTVRRLRLIFILRRLNISLDKIKAILNNKDTMTAVNVFNEKLEEVDNDIIALETIKCIVESFISLLNTNIDLDIDEHLLSEYSLDIIDSMQHLKQNIKEKKTMDDLNKANEVLIKTSNYRAVYLPPATVASSHQGICAEPEQIAGDGLKKFIKESKLCDIKPDFRHYGFNNPEEKGQGHGYEFWVTIPKDMEIQLPMTKKQFGGGLYIAHHIKMGDFHEWETFYKFVDNDDKYEIDHREPLGMGGLLEEHLNTYNNYKNKNGECFQLDLLIPVREK